MWLECSSSNHSPGLIAGYFLMTTNAIGGFPNTVRTDCGTENVLLATIQSLAVDSRRSHIYGTSPGNQRIESWWSFLRRSNAQWWIELFQSLVECDAFHPGNLRETDCLRFCFMQLLQDNLNSVRSLWNSHRIRPSVGARCPAGIPDVLYCFPIPPAVDCLRDIHLALPVEVVNRLESKKTCQDAVFECYLKHLCAINNWEGPSNVQEAVQLYFKLLTAIC